MRKLLPSCIFIWTALATTLCANEIVCVAIHASDVETLGGWPLDRKWYAIALQNLAERGANRVFIDIAFPVADFAHPESDEFFYSELANNPKVCLLAGTLNPTVGDSLVILGRYSLPASQFFLPFSAVFIIENDMLWLKSNLQQSLLRWLVPPNFSLQNILFSFPETSAAPNFRFLEAVKGEVDCAGRDVFIYLDYPGITSYIVNENTRNLISTSELQLYAAQQIRAGNYAVKWPDWKLAVLFLVTLLPLIRYKKMKWLVCSLGLVVMLFVAFYFGGVYIAKVWYGVTAIPTVILCYEMISSRVARKIEKRRTSFTLPHAAENPLQSTIRDEIKQLREKLGFYEHLMNQAPPVALKNKGHPDILYLPESPLVPILQKAEQIAAADIPVMIFGESGTGKEQLAKFMHESCGRSYRPFIAVNCASLNENLIESELFGYEAGAFTGAVKRKIGRFELADGGTLFLDEIGETSTSFQVKLLRVLQEGAFERVGGVEPIRVSVRLIAATNQNLHEAIQTGRFREDLFYRLNGFSLHLPPLRERKQDVAHLFRAFLFESNPEIQLSESIISWVSAQKWPGNIRELKSATKRAVINAQLKRRRFLLPEDFELQQAVDVANDDTKNPAEKILQALRQDGFRHRSISSVAGQLGLHRATVTEYLRGWVIRYLREYEPDQPQLHRALAGEAELADHLKFKARINQYAISIRNRIEVGLRKHETADSIKYFRFKNLPGEFEQDLNLLIEKIKNEARH